MTEIRNLPLPGPDWAIFLDVDGTLIEIADTPDSVFVDSEVVPILTRLREAVGGAVAVVSGRPLAELDRLLAPLVLPAAGLHGLERRNHRGEVLRPTRAVSELARIREPLLRFAESAPGTILEDKGLTLALHYRRVPEIGAAARRLVEELVAPFGGDLHVQEGKMVLEIKPPDVDKGTVIEAFMTETPFATRKPIFIGDDVTDEDGFEAVNRCGGYSIRVGEVVPTAARGRIGTVAELREWLAGIPAAIEAGARRASRTPGEVA
jgi:trehalose 6-phosphate phosphatase